MSELGEVGRAYEGCRGRVGELVRGASDDVLDRRVPACPDWRVRDVVAHLVGVVDDALAGRLDGAATDPWTAAQVDARRGRPIVDVVAEWDEKAPAFEAFLDAAGEPGRQAVFDAVTHEHDLRGALGRTGARDSDAVGIGVGFIVPLLVASADAAGVPLRVEAGDRVWGGEQADAVVRAEPFEVLRASAGRRSEAQLRALGWEGDVGAAVPVFTYGPFRPAAEALTD